MMKLYPLLLGLVLALGIVIRISAITPFAITLSYILLVCGALGLVVWLVIKPRA